MVPSISIWVIALWHFGMLPWRDDQHASNSVEAAKRMMKTIETVNAQLKKILI